MPAKVEPHQKPIILDVMLSLIIAQITARFRHSGTMCNSCETSCSFQRVRQPATRLDHVLSPLQTGTKAYGEVYDEMGYNLLKRFVVEKASEPSEEGLR